jgi:uncharacterized protein YxjI
VGRRGRRQDRQEDRQAFGRGGSAIQYQMRQKLVSIGDDFWIEDSNGNKAFKVDGKALRVRKTLNLEDPSGTKLASIQDRPVRIRESMEIEGPDGETIATVKKAMITPVRERYTVSVAGGSDIEVKGNIVDHEYEMEVGRNKVAEVSKKWFRVRDSYGVQVEPGQDITVILMATVAIDMMSH